MHKVSSYMCTKFHLKMLNRFWVTDKVKVFAWIFKFKKGHNWIIIKSRVIWLGIHIVPNRKMCAHVSFEYVEKFLSYEVRLKFRTMQTHFDTYAADDSCKHRDKRRNCSKQAISPLATMFSTLFIIEIFHVLPKCFHSHLLQIFCMWESVK